MMQGKVVQEELERKLLEQKGNSFKVEELLGQKVSSLKEELQQEKQVGEEARRQADQNIGAKIQEISQLEIRLHEESSLKLNMEAKMNEEKKELLRELEENSGNLHQLRSEVTLKEEQIGILQEKLEQQKTENIKAEEILSKEQSISETRRTEYEEKIQE